MKRRRLPSPDDIHTAAELLDLRDEAAVARDLALALVLAASAPTLPRDERAALGQVGALIRERLQAIIETLDRLSGAR